MFNSLYLDCIIIGYLGSGLIKAVVATSWGVAKKLLIKSCYVTTGVLREVLDPWVIVWVFIMSDYVIKGIFLVRNNKN